MLIFDPHIENSLYAMVRAFFCVCRVRCEDFIGAAVFPVPAKDAGDVHGRSDEAIALHDTLRPEPHTYDKVMGVVVP